MLAVFLLVLKIIGIILLCIIGIFLLLLLMVLFVPVRYRFDGYKSDCTGDYYIKAGITYFLHVVSISCAFDGDFTARLKILGITIKKKSKRFRSSENEDLNDEKTESEPDAAYPTENDYQIDWNEAEPYDNNSDIVEEDAEDNIDIATLLTQIDDELIVDDSQIKDIIEDNIAESVLEEVNRQLEIEENESDIDLDNNEDNNAKGSKDENHTSAEENQTDDKLGFWKKIHIYFDKIRELPDLIHNFLDRAGDYYDTIISNGERLRKKADYIERMYSDPANRRAVHLGIKQIKYLIKKCLPRKVKGYIHFGTDDPEFTGKILAFLACISHFLPRKLQIVPDFDKVIAEGNITAKGYFRVFTIVVIGWKLLFNKDVRRLYKLIRK